MKKSLFIGMACWLTTASVGAQEPASPWTLEECIRYAIEHNITLKQQEQVLPVEDVRKLY